MNTLHEHFGNAIRIPQPEFGSMAVFKHGIGRESEYVNWCIWVLEQLETSEKLGERKGKQETALTP